MRFGRTQKILSYIISCVAVTPVLLYAELSVAYAFVFAALALAGWWLEPPLTRSRRFRRAVTGVVLALLVAQLGRLAAGEPMARLGMEFAVLLLGIKLASRGTSGDYQQIAILSFLHVIAATVVIDDLSYAASFLLFVLLCPPVLGLTHLRSEMERRFSADDADPESQEMLTRLLGSRRVITPGFLAASGFLSLPILLLTAVLFVSFPRFGLGFLGRLPTSESVAGFTDQVALGDIDVTRLEDTVMIRLEPIGDHRRPHPDRLSLKVRGAVFDIFEEDVWRRSGDPRWEKMIGPQGEHHLAGRGPTVSTPGFEVLLESFEPSLVFLPEGTVHLTTYPKGRAGLLKQRRLRRNPLGLLKYSDDARVGIRYRVYLTGAPPFGDPPDEERTYLELPPGSERLVSLARELAGSGPPGQLAASIKRGLNQRYKYSMELSGSEANALADTPLDRFLFTRRTGTCEHFATAYTLMLRAVGIPARMATGFSGADWNPIGEYYSVRKRSAHSWTEAYLGGRWTTMDATPSAAGGPGRAGPSRIALLIDTMRMRWHKYVVGFDASSQAQLTTGLRRAWYETLDQRRALGELPRWLLGVVPGVLILAGLAVFWWRRRRTLGSGPTARRARSREEVEATRIYQALERRLARLGHSRPPSRTPGEHLAHLRDTAPELATDAGEVTLAYHEIRFGGRSFAPGEAGRLSQRIRGIGAG